MTERTTHLRGDKGAGETKTDEDLLQQYITTGNQACFADLFNRYTGLLYGVCLKYLHDAARAEDAVMQLFEELLPQIGRHQIRVFRTWLYSVTKNHCLQILRNEKKKIITELTPNFMESDEILHLLDDEDVSETDERLNALGKCMTQLPEQQRIAITKFFMDEMSYADIAAQTGFTANQVKSYIQNGKRNLKICIERNR
ncbi:MAG: sigma-70 family RNA polymerase sigma factor [Bacteroidales bacterium]|jgi:RNA polymerase sigma-70 factor (ECF subfamily)|nr:sigma-70 family RNA polymerase sigma factor [Bacteroidales bacterium]